MKLGKFLKKQWFIDTQTSINLRCWNLWENYDSWYKDLFPIYIYLFQHSSRNALLSSFLLTILIVFNI